MSTTILRGTRHHLAARIAAGRGVATSYRSLTVSACSLRDLPSRNWGSAPKGNAPPARDRGAAPKGNAPPARDWGAAPKGNAAPTRNWGQRPPSDGSGGRPRGQRDRRKPRDDNAEPQPRQSWGLRGANADSGRRDAPPPVPGSKGAMARWAREQPPATTATPRSAQPDDLSSRSSEIDALANSRTAEIDALANERNQNMNDYGDDSYSSYDVSDRGRGWDDSDEKHNRRRRDREERESRSLLHTSHGDYLPPTRHHSDKKGKDKDRGNKRTWVVDDDEALIAARDEFLRQEAEKARKAAERAKKEEKAKQARAAAIEKDVFIPDTISVAQLADKFGIKAIRLMRKMQQMGMPDMQCRPDYLLNSEDASNLALEYNLNPIIDMEKAFDIYPEPETDADLAKCPLRPPVVTIMGHVDHGKTTLLDSLRRTSVAAGEAGGITQHIAAFSVPLNSILPAGAPKTDATITFLDTPGHAAFTGMRARGASVTDLVVLVVAADDGVMPQTKEVINLVKAAGDTVGLVVAINKCDKPMIDIDRVKAGLGAEGIILEEDGGDVPAVRVSGLTKLGLDDLVETLSTLAEIRDLRARKTGKAEGYVLESHVDKGQGIVSTVLVSRGTLRLGSAIVAGRTWARVRTMYDSTGQEIESAGPGTPVTITGWRDVPVAGDQMLEAINGEDEAKKAVDNRERDAERKAMAIDQEEINARRHEDRLRHAAEVEDIKAAKEAGKNITHLMHAQRRAADTAKETGKKELRLLIKGDVSGTVEAVVGALSPIGNAEASVKIIQTGVGDVSEWDIMHAEASDAMVVGFNVECPRSIMTLANMSSVPVHVDSVIYRLIDSVRGRVAALLPPRIEYHITGEALVQQVFEIKLSRKDVKVIAGCKVGNGVISRAQGVRVLRGPDRDVVYEGTIETFKHHKKDVTEMRKGTECGIGLAGFTDLKEGDAIVTFNKVEVARTL